MFLSRSRRRFRDFCRQQGVSSREVLTQLAELYVSSEGSVLRNTSHSIPPAPVPLPEETTTDLLDRIERLECDDREFVHAFEVLIHRVEALETRLGSAQDSPKHTPKH